MIHLDHVSFWYRGIDEQPSRPTLRDVTLDIPEGEMVLIAGRTGSGKSTLLGTINGLVPHFTGGHLEGTVTVGGLSTRDHPPRELSATVGVVRQDPLSSFVTDTVEEELAYGMEQRGLSPATMRRRVEETLDLLGIADLRHRPLRALSGGQQQRVAMGAVLTMQPPALVLDEPTSALDPIGAEDVLATMARLVQDLGTTIVLAEHKMERVVPFVDRIVHVPGDGTVTVGTPETQLAAMPFGPPLVGLGKSVGWSPLPMSVRSARRVADPLRDQLATVRPPARASLTASEPPALAAREVVVKYGPLVAVRNVDLELQPGQVTALMGRNGSGKSSLLWALQGSGPRQSGAVAVDGVDPLKTSARRARELVGLVPQTASDLLYWDSVEAECAAADLESSVENGTTAALLERLAPRIDPRAHPRDLSEGQRLSLVLAVQLSARPAVMLLDEPTRGLDYAAKDVLADLIGGLTRDGLSVVVATHDVEFVATIADRVVLMADGDIVVDSSAVEALAGSPAFSTQVAKVLGPPWLTVNDVVQALTTEPCGIDEGAATQS